MGKRMQTPSSGQQILDIWGVQSPGRLVRPPDAVTDARTAITGIQVADLEQVDFDLSEAQVRLGLAKSIELKAELRKLMGPSTAGAIDLSSRCPRSWWVIRCIEI